MEVTYIKVFVSWLEALEPFSEEERGRLLTAMLEYAKGGCPTLPGNERFIFPMIKSQLDRDRESLEKISHINSENGKKGGRPKKATESELNRSVSEKANASEKRQEKEKDKEKEEDKDKSIIKRFKPPTVAEVQAYCDERQNGINADHFVDYYATRGWKVSNNPMRDWKAAVRTWERNGYSKTQNSQTASTFVPSEAETRAVNDMKRWAEQRRAANDGQRA